mmetsp:Transcript_9178/g.17537  ORF Transcript_9178/g.17537 Transcript_9178/m.17537 type:complete len:99 (-) Transcript_9178:125-421(-)
MEQVEETEEMEEMEEVEEMGETQREGRLKSLRGGFRVLLQHLCTMFSLCCGALHCVVSSRCYEVVMVDRSLVSGSRSAAAQTYPLVERKTRLPLTSIN